MNQRSDIDRVLQVWMADGPAAIPDRVVDVVAARIGVQRQQRTRRLPWRPFMNTYAKLAAAAAAIVVVGFVGWQLVPGTTGPGGEPSATVTPSPQPTPAETAAPSAGGGYPAGYPVAGILSAGSHTTRFFTPRFSFTVPEGWINDGDEAGSSSSIGFYALFPDTPNNRAEFARTGNPSDNIVIVSGLERPWFVCESLEDNRGATAAEIAAAVMANDVLATNGLTDVEIGGLTGKQFDVWRNPEFTGTCPSEPAASSADARTRGILLDAPDGSVLVMFVGTLHAADFEAFLADAMPVVESFDFGQ